MKQRTNTYRNLFSRSYENRSNKTVFIDKGRTLISYDEVCIDEMSRLRKKKVKHCSTIKRLSYDYSVKQY